MTMKPPWMTHQDRRAWKSATTLADVGELTARWLEGDLNSRPAYQPRYGPDNETADLIPTLAACNRAGFLTDSSQPGWDGEGFDGARWQQRAAVQGFIEDPDLLENIRAKAAEADVVVVIHYPGAPAGWCMPASMVATLWAGQPHTSFGDEVPASHLRAMWTPLRESALRELTTAPQVALVDPMYGRNDLLWPLLDLITGRLASLH